MFYEQEQLNTECEFLSYSMENMNWHIHFHEAFEICLVTDGEICITVENMPYNLKKGDGAVIFPRQLHSYETASSSRLHMITFLPSFVPDFVRLYKNMLPVSNALGGLCKYSSFFAAEDRLSQKGLAYMLLGGFSANTEFKQTVPREESQLLLKVLKFVECNYSGDCSLRTAAEQLSYGYTYLSRVFGQLMNMSYMEYVNKYRINRAVYMLSVENPPPVREVAERCGYNSICSFNRNFRQFAGCTPSGVAKTPPLK